MSDEAAAAPVETPTEAAPADAGERPAAEAKPPPKPRTVDDDIEDIFKKAGGLKYKAGGSEKTITSVKDLRQHLSRVSGVDAAAAEALKEKQEAAALKAKKESIKKLKGADRARAIAEFFEEDHDAMREAFAEDILADDAKRQERAKMSERERQMQDELDRYRTEAEKAKTEREELQRQREEEEFTKRVTEVGARLESTAVKALGKAKIPAEHAPRFLQAIAERLDRNERLGLGLDEDEVAEVVMNEHGSLADAFYGSLDVGALADRLEAQMADDSEKPGEKVSKLKLLMRECARRIKAKMGVAPVVSNGAARMPAKPVESDAEKMAFWRR